MKRLILTLLLLLGLAVPSQAQSVFGNPSLQGNNVWTGTNTFSGTTTLSGTFTPITITFPTTTGTIQTGTTAGDTVVFKGYDTSGTPQYRSVLSIAAAAGIPTITVPASIGLTFADGAPASTTTRLYNNGGVLTWNGTALANSYPGTGLPVSTGSAWGSSLSSTAPIFTASVTAGAIATQSVVKLLPVTSANRYTAIFTPVSAGLTADRTFLIPDASGTLATQEYANSIAGGLDLSHPNARCATAAAGTLASDFENGDTIDGTCVLATNDRILIKNQASTAENGVYFVNASGAPTRVTDMDADAEARVGSYIFVTAGATNALTGWVINTYSGTIGGGMTWAMYESAVAYSATAPIQISGSTISLTATTGTGAVVAAGAPTFTSTVTVVDQVLGSATNSLYVAKGLHVGGTSDAGDNNLLVDGTATVTGAALFPTSATVGAIASQSIITITPQNDATPFTGTLTVPATTGLSADRTWTLPNESGTVSMAGMLRYVGVTDTYVIATTVDVVNCGTKTASAAYTVTLPDAAATAAGRRYYIKRSGTSVITIASAGGTIDGEVSISLPIQYQGVEVVSDGTNWIVL